MDKEKASQMAMQKVDELIEVSAEHIKESIRKRGLSDNYVEGIRALAELVSARAATEKKAISSKRKEWRRRSWAKSPIPIPCPPKSKKL